jgi:hypothetical protein
MIMAHFMKPPGISSEGYDVDNKLAPGSLQRVRIPLGRTRKVALWGGAGLKVTSNNPNVVPNDRLRELPSVGNLRIFELFGASEGGSWIDVWGSNGAFWIRLQALVAVPLVSGKRYTNNPNEVVTRQTTPTPQNVVAMILSSWTQLTNNGARTLTAQFMVETGGGRYCFNWNLGNVKAPSQDVSHMYLRNVWECISKSQGEAQVAGGRGLVRIAMPEEIQKRGWRCTTGAVVVVFDPPHPTSRFRAYGSLQEGAQRWIGHHQKIARANSNYINALNTGDIVAVAKALKVARYYTASESDYARAMIEAKATIDRALGSLPIPEFYLVS